MTLLDYNCIDDEALLTVLISVWFFSKKNLTPSVDLLKFEFMRHCSHDCVRNARCFCSERNKVATKMKREVVKVRRQLALQKGERLLSDDDDDVMSPATAAESTASEAEEKSPDEHEESPERTAVSAASSAIYSVVSFSLVCAHGIRSVACRQVRSASVGNT